MSQNVIAALSMIVGDYLGFLRDKTEEHEFDLESYKSIVLGVKEIGEKLNINLSQFDEENLLKE